MPEFSIYDTAWDDFFHDVISGLRRKIQEYPEYARMTPNSRKETLDTAYRFLGMNIINELGERGPLSHEYDRWGFYTFVTGAIRDFVSRKEQSDEASTAEQRMLLGHIARLTHEMLLARLTLEYVTQTGYCSAA